MSSRKRPKVAPALRRQLDVAAAIATEELLRLHAARALDLVELAGERVSAPRILAIYARLHGLDAVTSHAVATRVLATLGQRADEDGIPMKVYNEEEEEDVAQDSQSLFRVVRDRLRGRIHHDLRRWVELHTGETQIKLLDLHATHALRFVTVLADEAPLSSAVDTYVRMMPVREQQRETLYYSVLARLAAEELPRPGTVAATQVPLFADDGGRAARRAV